MRRRRVSVSDRMQSDYSYALTEPESIWEAIRAFFNDQADKET